jgi:hypothetical protein
MTPDLEKSITEKYPSLFANLGQKGSPMCFGLEVGDGWAGIISTMCWIIDQKDAAKTFRFDQVKEKFGLLRVYHTGGNEYMAGVVRMACDISGAICEVCGQPGEQRRGGWIKTLCDRCHATPADIVARLREEVAGESEVGELMSLAATEIEVQRACTSAARDEIERLRQVSSQKNLTDAEREAVAYYLGTGGPDRVHATLLSLLSRTGTDVEEAGDNATECTDKE